MFSFNLNYFNLYYSCEYQVVEIPISCPGHQSENPGSITLASCATEVGCSTGTCCKEPRAVLTSLYIREEPMRAIQTQWITSFQLTLPSAVLLSIYLTRTDFARYKCLETSRSVEALCCASASVKVAFCLVICFTITFKCSQTDRMIPCWGT